MQMTGDKLADRKALFSLAGRYESELMRDTWDHGNLAEARTAYDTARDSYAIAYGEKFDDRDESQTDHPIHEVRREQEEIARRAEALRVGHEFKLGSNGKRTGVVTEICPNGFAMVESSKGRSMFCGFEYLLQITPAAA